MSTWFRNASKLGNQILRAIGLFSVTFTNGLGTPAVRATEARTLPALVSSDALSLPARLKFARPQYSHNRWIGNIALA
jgi:hypothetical protein